MGKRGPKPKPTAVRIFEGDPGHRLGQRAGEVAPESGSAVPKAPSWLGQRGVAKWKELSPHLHAIGCLTLVDLDCFALYCDAFDELHRAIADIAEFGNIISSTKGGQYQNPAVGIKSNAIKRIRQFACDYGMTPAARVGLNLGDANKPDDELEALKASTA